MKLVSVFMITYNHEKFIGQAIESIVTQQVSFDFELVIGEDSSTDHTLDICKQYAEQYPDIVKLLPSDKNHGVMGNTVRVLNACTGKYIAMCEGDDYWCDPHKLQKQVDFLEAHPDFAICFSEVSIKDELGWNRNDEYYFPKLTKNIFTFEDIILSEMSLIPTATMLFRNVLPDPLPDFFLNAMVGDMTLQAFAADKGKAKLLNEKMAVYRNHTGGVTKSKNNIEYADAALMKFYRAFNEYTDFRYNAIFRKRFLDNAKMRLIFGARDKKGWERIKHYFKKMPVYLKYSDKINFKEIIYYHMVLFFPSLLERLKKKK